MAAGGPGVMVLNTNTKREQGKKAQLGNIAAAKAVADTIRTTLGPRSMLKMILDAMGGIVMTNDGNAILREIDVSHPAAKSMIELSRTQDEEVGDGTTSVIVMAGEVLHMVQPFLETQVHPTVIIAGMQKALEDAVVICKASGREVKLDNAASLTQLVETTVGTKFTSRFSEVMVELALEAVKTVAIEDASCPGGKEIDIKRYAKIEKIPGGEIDDCRVLKGIMFNKDVSHAKMRRRIENPRILLLDCPLEYKKSESQAQVECSNEEDWELLLRQEEDWIKATVEHILKFKPDVVITEKGLSDLAQHFFVRAGVTALRRLRKTDNNRAARACGARVVHRVEEITEDAIGTGAGLYEVRKIGDEYHSFIVDCKDPKACTILLRGGSKDVLNEVERNLHDAMNVARNVYKDPMTAPGGGALEMEVSAKLMKKSNAVEPKLRNIYRAVATAFEVIPRILAANCGANVVRLVTELRAKHAQGENAFWGVDGELGTIVDMDILGVWEPMAVKVQTLKTAIESAILLLRVDDVVSGVSKKRDGTGGNQSRVEKTNQAGAMQQAQDAMGGAMEN
jgi:T-complex protein 1 subunit gamma